MTEVEPLPEDERAGQETRASRREDGKQEAIEAELIPEAVEDAIVQRVAMRMERYSSPHPHPEHLERYAALYPDAPKIVFESYRDQGEHRREMEAAYMKGSERRANIGQWLAFTLVAGAITGGIVAIAHGLEWAGGVIIVASLGGGVILAISGNKQEGAPKAKRAPSSERGQAVGEVVPSPKPPKPTEPSSK